MRQISIQLDADAVARLESAKLHPQESMSDVVRRATFPKKFAAADLLKDFDNRFGTSPLSDEALEILRQVQENPNASPSHWNES